MRIKDEDGTWLVLTSWGRRKIFELQGCSWSFDGSLNLPPRDKSDFGSPVRLANLCEMSKQEIRVNHVLSTTGNFDSEFVQEATQIIPGTVLQTNKAQTIGRKQ